MRRVGISYFSEGVFAQALPGELFQKYTCTACGHCAATWASFRAHRRGCPGYPPQVAVPALWSLDDDDLERLAGLYEQLRQEALTLTPEEVA